MCLQEIPNNTKIFNLKINYNSQIKSPPNITTKFNIFFYNTIATAIVNANPCPTYL